MCGPCHRQEAPGAKNGARPKRRFFRRIYIHIYTYVYIYINPFSTPALHLIRRISLRLGCLGLVRASPGVPLFFLSVFRFTNYIAEEFNTLQYTHTHTSVHRRTRALAGWSRRSTHPVFRGRCTLRVYIMARFKGREAARCAPSGRKRRRASSSAKNGRRTGGPGEKQQDGSCKAYAPRPAASPRKTERYENTQRKHDCGTSQTRSMCFLRLPSSLTPMLFPLFFFICHPSIFQ